MKLGTGHFHHLLHFWKIDLQELTELLARLYFANIDNFEELLTFSENELFGSIMFFYDCLSV